jgi:hypothetical protein
MLRHLVRPLSALAALPLAVPLAVLLAAPAAANNRPDVTVTPTVNGTSATVHVDINRGKQAIDSCGYVLDAAPGADCGSPIDGGKKQAGYDIGLSGLSGGSHTMAVTIVLTDGGGDSGSAEFTVVAGPRVFALAFSNVDGFPGFDPANDVLIAKLVDTTGDGLLDLGDTVVTERYPLDFAPTRFGPFGTFGLTSHEVANVSTTSSTSAVVTDGAGRQYSFGSSDTSQKYQEATSGTPRLETSIFDSFGSLDTIHAQSSAPSHPDTLVDPRIFGTDLGDSPFIDVVMDMP